jgi:hypothetical protein
LPVTPIQSRCSVCNCLQRRRSPTRRVESIHPINMRLMARFIRVTSTLAFSATTLSAQATPPSPPASSRTAAAADTSTLQSQAIRVFLDCQCRVRGCDRDFFVTEIGFVNWMRDRFDSDVTILVSGLQNGGGGNENTITFIGRRKFEGMVDTLVLNTLPNDPDDRIRRDLARTFTLGLARFAAKSPIAKQLQVSFVSPTGARPVRSAANLKDRWILWTYTSNANAFVRAEELQRSVNGSLAFSANRATDKWKINLSTSGNLSSQRFTIPATGTNPKSVVTSEQRT